MYPRTGLLNGRAPPLTRGVSLAPPVLPGLKQFRGEKVEESLEQKDHVARSGHGQHKRRERIQQPQSLEKKERRDHRYFRGEGHGRQEEQRSEERRVGKECR